MRPAAEIVFFGLAAAAFAAVDAVALGVAYGALAITCAALVRYVGEPETREPGATPAA